MVREPKNSVSTFEMISLERRQFQRWPCRRADEDCVTFEMICLEKKDSLAGELTDTVSHSRWSHWKGESLARELKNSHLIYPLTMRVVGAPQMISQPVSSIFARSPRPSGTRQTPDLSIPWCLPISSFVSMPLVLLVISLVFSALISMPQAVEALSRHSTNFASSSSSHAKPSMSLAKRRLLIVLPPMLTAPSWSSNGRKKRTIFKNQTSSLYNSYIRCMYAVNFMEIKEYIDI